MSSQYQTFFLPADAGEGAADALNLFVRQHRVQKIDRQFVSAPVSGWAFCVVFDDGTTREKPDTGKSPPRIDYREALNTADFQLFDQLRSWRADVAEVERKHLITATTTPVSVWPSSLISDIDNRFRAMARVSGTSAVSSLSGFGYPVLQANKRAPFGG